MRYYVLTDSEHDDVVPHIVAEVVRDRVDGKAAAMICALTTDRTIVLTREELLAHALGVEVLKAWDSGDDGAYDRASNMTRAQGLRTAPKLRLVPKRGR